MNLIENAVTIAEVAKVTKSPAAAVEAEARKLNLFVGTDWAGRPAVDVRDAHALVSGAARHDAENSTANRDHLLAVEAWEGDRMRVHRAAYQAALEEANRAGIGGGQAFDRAKAAAKEAVERYETDTPPPTTLGGLPGARNWFAKVKEAVR